MALLTVPEVAERLRVHQMTVRRHIRSGKLPAMRVGRRYRIREEDVGAMSRPVVPRPSDFPTLRDWAMREPTPEELAHRRRIIESILAARAKQKPLGISTAELIRQGREERARRIFGDT